MPPRRRLTKRGWTRMDAALDAMKKYGFTEALVRTTVNELLELYEDGWPFIEENSYSVLLETMLEKGEKDQPKNNELQKKESVGRDIGTPPAGASIVPPVSTCHVEKVATLASHANDGLASASKMRSTTLKIDDTHAHISTLEGVGSTWEYGTLNQGCKEEQVIGIMGTSDRSHGIGELENTSKPIVSPQPVQCRHKPCCGWISDDGEDNKDDVLYLPSAPIPSGLAQMLCDVGDARKRRRRWDVKGEYMCNSLHC